MKLTIFALLLKLKMLIAFILLACFVYLIIKIATFHDRNEDVPLRERLDLFVAASCCDSDDNDVIRKTSNVEGGGGGGKEDKPFVHTSGYIPSIVYVVWCGRRWFEFHHYISLKSAIRSLHPDAVIFYCDYLPILDRWMYNTWFQELKTEFPFFQVHQVTAAEGACDGHARPSVSFIRSQIMLTTGGIYVNEHTVIDHFPESLWTAGIVDAVDNRTGVGFLAMRRGNNGLSAGDNVGDSRLPVKRLRCVSIDSYNVEDNNSSLQKPVTCVNTPKEAFYPKDIWELNTRFGRLTRQVFYGDEAIRKVARSSTTLIPNIAHIIWIGGGEMDYLFYLCVLSVLYVAKVDALYIYGDQPPTGSYWLAVRTEPRLHWVYRDVSKTVFGTRVDVISHMTDVWRADFMVRYGGIYIDTDAIFVRPLDDVIRSHDAVGTYDWTYWEPPFPDTINFGVAIGKRGARYWRRFLKSMQWFVDTDWSWNGLRQPYKIKERHPELLHIDPHLQITCYKNKCHPTWWPDYHKESVHHVSTNSITNWTTDAFVYHWTSPTPPEFESEETLLASNSMFADMGKFVLRKANRLHV